jgi:hypothetical protein
MYVCVGGERGLYLRKRAAVCAIFPHRVCVSVSVYLCLCVRAHVYVIIFANVCICLHTHAGRYIHTYMCVKALMNTHIYMYIPARERVCVCVCVCVCLHIYTHIHVCTQAGCHLLWRKYVSKGLVDMHHVGTPSFSHIMCFGKGANAKYDSTKFNAPDVIPRYVCVRDRVCVLVAIHIKSPIMCFGNGANAKYDWTKSNTPDVITRYVWVSECVCVCGDIWVSHKMCSEEGLIPIYLMLYPGKYMYVCY